MGGGEDDVHFRGEGGAVGGGEDDVDAKYEQLQVCTLFYGLLWYC